MRFLVDTGVDRTILSPLDAARFGLDLATLPLDSRSRGIGGEVATRSISAIVTFNDYSKSLTLRIIESTDPIPSLLGRDVLSNFALFMEERSDRILLLDEAEARALQLP